MTSHVCHKPHIAIIGALAVLLLQLTGCPPFGGGGGGVTIAPTDATPPTLALGAGQPGGQNVSVSDSGEGQSMNITSKTGALNLLATAKDSESGVQTLEIWVNSEKTTCDAGGNCTLVGPGLMGKPMFSSTSPAKNSGDVTAESSTLADALELSAEIPQAGPPAGGSRTVTLSFFAVAVNHKGGRTQTPEIKATWREP